MPRINPWIVGGLMLALAAPVSGAEVSAVSDDVDVDMSAAEVWHFLTTEEGLESWLVPAARVELRIGGAYELGPGPDPNAPGPRMEGTKVLSFVPERMLSVHGSAPPSFPAMRGTNTAWQVWELEPLAGKRTRVTLTGLFPVRGEAWEPSFEQWVRHAIGVNLSRLEQRSAEMPEERAAQSSQ